EVYRDFMVEVLAVPVLTGRKTARERFAGATTTWTCEAMMADGKALQMGTSHELGQNFSRAFGIEFQSETGESVHGWQTSWGASTRLVGGLVMAHGDDSGLRLPPRIAPVQVVVVLVRDEEGSGPAAERLTSELAAAGHREARTAEVSTVAEAKEAAQDGFARVPWRAVGVDGETELAAAGASVRCLLADDVAVVGRAY